MPGREEEESGDHQDERVGCNRGGNDFRVELCVVYEGEAIPEAGIHRDRVEAHLCYKCRQEIPNEPLGVYPNEGETA